MNILEHERCSELLGDYVAGELPREQVAAVQDHLQGCIDCRAEQRAVEALVSPANVPMSDVERARLHRGLGWGQGSARRRPAAWLGAVATIALIAVAAAVWLPQQGGGDADTAGGDAAEPVQDAGRDHAETLDQRDADEPDAAAGAAAEQNARVAPPRPVYESNLLEVSQPELASLAKTAPPFPEYAAFFDAEDAERLDDRYGRLLMRALPGDAADQIQECIDAVSAALPYPILPAFAAHARVEGETLFVLGFTWTFSATGPLDRFMLWGWRPDRCSKPPVVYQTGIIDR